MKNFKLIIVAVATIVTILLFFHILIISRLSTVPHYRDDVAIDYNRTNFPEKFPESKFEILDDEIYYKLSFYGLHTCDVGIVGGYHYYDIGPAHPDILCIALFFSAPVFFIVSPSGLPLYPVFGLIPSALAIALCILLLYALSWHKNWAILAKFATIALCSCIGMVVVELCFIWILSSIHF